MIAAMNDDLNLTEIDEDVDLFADDYVVPALNYLDCRGDVHPDENSPFLRSAPLDAFRLGAPQPFRRDLSQSVVLFGGTCVRRSVLHSRLNCLIKKAWKEVNILECAAKSQIKGSYSVPSRDFFSLRKNCVDFYSFLHEYFACITCGDELYKWCVECLARQLISHLYKLNKRLRPLTSLPESIYLHSANPRGNKCTQPSHHLFHLHLELRWMSANLLLKLHEKLGAPTLPMDSQFVESLLISQADLQKLINRLLFEFVDLAFFRFEKLYGSECSQKSPFSCSCVQTLWVFLFKYYQALFSDDDGKTFWNTLCGYLERINDLSNHEWDHTPPARTNATSSSSKVVFSLWLLSNVANLLKSYGLEISSYHSRLEILLKHLVSVEANESDVKNSLVFIESLCLELWEPKVEPVVCLWEYFHKKLNSSFYAPGSSIDAIATLCKTAGDLLRKVRNLIESKRSSATTSFQHFVRLVGLHLRRTKDCPRHWNVIKGRIFSKLSGPKVGALSQTGEHNLVTLFVGLAVSVGVGQVESKFIEILTTVKKAKGNISSDLIQGQMALIVLSINENRNFSHMAHVLVEHINSINPLEDFDVLKTFAVEVQEIFGLSAADGLGLHLFLDSWMSNFLTCCSPNESSCLLESALTVVNRLKIQSCLTSPDQETVMFVERLWEQISSYFNTMISQLPIRSADLAASLVTLFTMMGNSDRASAIVNLFVTKDCVEIWLVRRFITKMILSESSILPSYNKIIIQAWIRCCILCNDAASSEMKSLTNYVSDLEEIRSLCSDDDYNLSVSKEPLLYMCSSFSSKFDTVQNIFQKQNLRLKFTTYFDGISRWIKSISGSSDFELVSNLYKTFGNVVRLCAHLIYSKSKPNTVLQQIVDSLLLLPSVRNPDHKLSSNVLKAVKGSFHLYLEGLFQLSKSDQDTYITRIFKELVSLYVPRCVTLPSPLPLPVTGEFALIRQISSFPCDFRCAVLDVITCQFLKKKAKVPHPQACYALKFLRDVLCENQLKADSLKCFIRKCFERLCDVVMFCDEKSAALSHSKTILKNLLNLDILREDSDLMDSLTYSLAAVCNEHLAWSSRQAYDLLLHLAEDAPDLIMRFIPVLLDIIKHIEIKRGVGYDKSLRFGLERIESKLRAIKSNVAT